MGSQMQVTKPWHSFSGRLCMLYALQNSVPLQVKKVNQIMRESALVCKTCRFPVSWLLGRSNGHCQVADSVQISYGLSHVAHSVDS